MSPRGKQQNESMRQETQAKITTAALRVFAAYGFHGTTMKMIAQETGLSYGLIYHYFKSKEEVFLYLIEEALTLTGNIFNRVLTEEQPAWRALSNLSAALLSESLTGDATLYFHVMLQAFTQVNHLTGLSDRLNAYSEILMRQMVGVILRGQQEGTVAAGNPVALATTYLSLIQGLALYAFHDERVAQMMTPDDLLRILAAK